MSVHDIWSVAGAVLFSLGGAAALVVGLSTWLGKVWANRLLEGDRARFATELEALKSRYVHDVERLRTTLKKSELLFEKEFEAASEFVGLVRSIRPNTTRPDMDWYVACDEIASHFEQHETQLEAYLARHGAILPDPVRDKLASCISVASEGKFHADMRGEIDPQWNKYADEFFSDLLDVEKALISQVRAQASA